MKTLTLLRHAKSGWDDPALDDFARGLNPRGRKAARAIGREMGRLGLRFDRIIASPAVRVVETIAGIGDSFGAVEPVYDKRLYLAPVSTLMDFIHEADDGADHLLIVGHNPGLEDLVLQLTPCEESGLRGEVEEKFPTASLASLSFDVSAWQAVSAESGQLLRFIRPRDLDPSLGPDPD